MYRSTANKAPQIRCLVDLPNQIKMGRVLTPLCHLFINHRGIETKRNIADLLHDYMMLHGLRSFLDYKTLMPGQRVSNEIKVASHQCKVGIPIFSPRYSESWHCLYELALLTEDGKRLVPIFWDIEPSQLQVHGRFPARHAKRFGSALDKARDTAGLAFDSSTGDRSKLLWDTYDAVQRIFLESKQQSGPSTGLVPRVATLGGSTPAS